MASAGPPPARRKAQSRSQQWEAPPRTAMDPRFPEQLQQSVGVVSCTTPTRVVRNNVTRGVRRCKSVRTPRCILLVVAVVASLVLALPTATGSGAGLRSTAPVKARGRVPDSAAERDTTSNGSSSRRSNARRSGGVDHDDTQARSLPSTRGCRRPGEGDEEHVGIDNGRRSKRGSDDRQGRMEAAAVAAGGEGAVRDTFGSSSVERLHSDKVEDEGSSWDSGYSDYSDGDSYSSSYENYDTEEDDAWDKGAAEEDERGEAEARPSTTADVDSDDPESSEEGSEERSEEEHLSDSYDESEDDSSTQHQHGEERGVGQGDGQSGDNSVEVCVVTWNLAEASPPARDLEFLKRASRESDLVAVGVQEIENLKPRRNEGGRTREWRRLLIRTLGRDFVRVGHHAMGAVQLTLFARRDVVERVKVVKLTEVVCGVGNVLQNKGGIGAYVRVDRTTFLFVAAHLAAHQEKVEDRNAGYWRIVTTLDQEIPSAWVTHATRKRAKRAKAAAMAAAAASEIEESAGADGPQQQSKPVPMPWLPGVRGPLPPRGPFGDRVDRVFFFGDLNYRVDLSREDLELGVSACRRQQAAEGAGEGEGKRGGEEKARGRRISERFRPGATYPGTGALDSLLDFDQLSLARSRGAAFGGFSEARVTFDPTYKYDKGSQHFDMSRKMRPPAWTDRILFSPPGPLGVSSLAYTSVPGSSHSDHRPVYAKFRVRLAD